MSSALSTSAELEDLRVVDAAGRDRVMAAAEALAHDGVVVLLEDGVDRPRGYLCVSAERVTARTLAFLAARGRGQTWVAMSRARAAGLGIESRRLAAGDRGPAFGPSVQARREAGAPPAGRAATMQLLADPHTEVEALQQPGNVLPVLVDDLGTLGAVGHPEAAVDLCRIGGLAPVATICEMLSTTGQPADAPQVREFARRSRLPIVRLPQVVEYRLDHEPLVHCREEVALPLRSVNFRAHAIRSSADSTDYMALVHGTLRMDDITPVYLLDTCAGVVFRSSACCCRESLDQAVAAIAARERGVVLYPDERLRLGHSRTPGEEERRRVHARQVLRLLGAGRVLWLDVQGHGRHAS